MLEKPDDSGEGSEGKDDHDDDDDHPADASLSIPEVSVLPDEICGLHSLLDLDIVREQRERAELEGFMVSVLSMEGAEEVTGDIQLVEVLILVLSHLNLDFFSFFKLSSLERVCTLSQKLMHFIVVESNLHIGYIVHVLASILVLVHLHQPVLNLIDQVHLKFLHHLFIIASKLLELFELNLRYLALDTVVAKSDELAVENLIVNDVGLVVDSESVSIHQAYGKTYD